PMHPGPVGQNRWFSRNRFAADLGKARAKRKASFASQRLRLLTRHAGRARYRSGFPSKERSACIPD
ncbi:MAG: hypothetical protein ACTS6O_14435, partial [Giesbergeria sp.]